MTPEYPVIEPHKDDGSNPCWSAVTTTLHASHFRKNTFQNHGTQLGLSLLELLGEFSLLLLCYTPSF